MAFTRFNYDEARTHKILMESTGPGKYMLNTPGQGTKPFYYEDPHIRLQKWGANLLHVPGGHPVDIASDLDGRSRRHNKYCVDDKVPFRTPVQTQKQDYSTAKSYTDETRTSHPAWMYRTLEQTRWEYPLLNPQENVCKHFENNVSSRILEKDNFVPKKPF